MRCQAVALFLCTSILSACGSTNSVSIEQHGGPVGKTDSPITSIESRWDPGQYQFSRQLWEEESAVTIPIVYDRSATESKMTGASVDLDLAARTAKLSLVTDYPTGETKTHEMVLQVDVGTGLESFSLDGQACHFDASSYDYDINEFKWLKTKLAAAQAEPAENVALLFSYRFDYYSDDNLDIDGETSLVGRVDPNDPGSQRCDIRITHTRPKRWIRIKGIGFYLPLPAHASAFRVSSLDMDVNETTKTIDLVVGRLGPDDEGGDEPSWDGLRLDYQEDGRLNTVYTHGQGTADADAHYFITECDLATSTSNWSAAKLMAERFEAMRANGNTKLELTRAVISYLDVLLPVGDIACK